MAEVTVFTAARSQQIEDTAVVNARINAADGHLILIQNNGTERDAGAISFFQATDTAAGSVELATVAEAQAGTDTQRAVTPAGLASIPGYKAMGVPVVFTTSGTFTKANYAGLKAVRVRVVGGGGGGGGAPFANTGNHSAGGGGGGGGYVEKFILANALFADETITVGSGGGGGTTIGGSGGTSSFGAHAVATGGAPGDSFSNNALMIGALGGAGGGGSVNSGVAVITNGGPGTIGGGNATLGHGGGGGSSVLGGGGAGVYTGAGSGSTVGNPGKNYGGGGGGAAVNSTGAANTGGAGAQGIVIVEVFI
jgi:hypothetical protein